MTTVYDVPPDLLVASLAEDLRKAAAVTPPEWAAYAKTGVHREKAPEDPDWWYRRLAAILRKVYVGGPVGTERLAAAFGGRRDGGSVPYHPRKGSRSVVRECLAQLESLGYVEKANNRGRVITPKGRSYLDNRAHEILQNLAVEKPELTKYL